MAIITISRGCYSHGREIAEKVAKILGYECVSREVLVEASKLFNVSEKKLVRSLHDAPTIIERMTHGKTRYLSHIKAALLGYVRKGNVVYHGHAGHLLLTEIPHVLKVRILADKEDRVVLVQKRENLSREEALALIENEDRNRLNWTRYLYKIDIGDPWLYDLVIKIGDLTIEDACEIVRLAAKSKEHLITEESKQVIDDLAIASYIQASLQSICDAEVSVTNGDVYVKVFAQKRRKTGYITPSLEHNIGEAYKEDLSREIHDIVNSVPGVKSVFCQIDLPYYG
jgi:cytidylate kinase